MSIDNSDVKEMYQQIDQDFNVYHTERDGKPLIVLGERYEGFLYPIERFVESIVNSDDDAFVLTKDRKGNAVFEALPLAKDFKSFNGYIGEFNPNYEFSEYVTVFFEAYQRFGMVEENFNNPNAMSVVAPDKRLGERGNEFVAYIRKTGRSEAVKRRIYDRAYKSVRNFESAKEYIDGMFAQPGGSRLLVLRVDLGYMKKYLPGSDLVAARKDLDRLLNNTRSNKLFKGLVGYIWKLENGVEKGHHFHCILFFDGSKVRHDPYLADLIGKYWVERITAGRGTFHNCNAEKGKYKYLGIGMISHGDDELRANLLKVVKYLTKKDQYLRKKVSNRRRVFGRGEMPGVRRSKAGRPRKLPN